MSGSIRNATLADVPNMAATYIAAFKVVDPSERWTEETACELISFFLRVQPDLAFVAEEDGKLLGGICGIAKPWWDGNHLVQSEIFILPAAQKNGVGRALFKHFLAVAKNKYKVTEMESITFKDLNFPSTWYKKLGFVDKDDWKVVFGDVDVLAERLGKGERKL